MRRSACRSRCIAKIADRRAADRGRGRVPRAQPDRARARAGVQHARGIRAVPQAGSRSRPSASSRTRACSRNEHDNRSETDMKRVGRIRRTARSIAAAATPARAQDYPIAADQGHHHHQRRRHRATSSCARSARSCTRTLGPAADRREPPGRRMNVGTRACAEAAPDGYTICITNADRDGLQPVPVQEHAVRSGEGAAADHQPLHLIHMLVVNSQLDVEDRRRAHRAVEGEGRHAELSSPRRRRSCSTWRR